MNFFNQGIPLGRWFGIRVILHWTFLAYAAFELWDASQKSALDLQLGAIVLALLFGTVLLHEFGHALACKAVGGTAAQIILWPLGGIAFVQPPMNPRDCLITTACGPLINAVLWPVFWWASRYGIPMLEPHVSLTVLGYLDFIFSNLWGINELLLIFNLIPAYPMDGGRLLQEILWPIIGYPRSLHVAGMIGTVCGACFVVLGLGLVSITIPIVHYPLGVSGEPEPILLIIGILVVIESFGIYKRSQEIHGWRKN